VHLVLDEFANIGRLPDFERTIAVVRSRNIGVSVVLQSFAQFKSAYGDDAETILDCRDTTLFLGGKSGSTNKGISQKSARRPYPPAPTTRPGARPWAPPPAARPPSATSSRPPRWESSTDAAPSCLSPARTPCAT